MKALDEWQRTYVFERLPTRRSELERALLKARYRSRLAEAGAADEETIGRALAFIVWTLGGRCLHVNLAGRKRVAGPSTIPQPRCLYP